MGGEVGQLMQCGGMHVGRQRRRFASLGLPKEDLVEGLIFTSSPPP